MANNSIKHCKDEYIPINEPDIIVESSPRLRIIDNFGDDNRFKRLKRESFNKEDYTTVPWMRRNIYSSGVIGLHEEINDFYLTLLPTNEEKNIRCKVIQHIKHVVHSLWPLAKVEVFGSSRTGLYLPTSDIDIVVSGKWDHLPLHTLRNALLTNGIKDEDINVLSNASVPLVRVIHSLTKIKVDISFNVRNGVKSAKLIKEFIKQYPALPKLLLILKQFLVHRALNEVYYGGMSSYTLTLLVISFLQGLHKPKQALVKNLGTLLIEFFELYGLNFNYEKVSLNILNGGSYRPKQNEWESYLSVLDPLCESNDIAKGTYLMYQIKSAFLNAFSTLNKAVTDVYNQNRTTSILRLILNVDAAVFAHRRWICENYSDILKSFPCFESDSASSDVGETAEEPLLSEMPFHAKLIDSGNNRNMSRVMCHDAQIDFLRTEFASNFEKVYSPSKHAIYAKQEWRMGQNRSRTYKRYRRNSATKNCDR